MHFGNFGTAALLSMGLSFGTATAPAAELSTPTATSATATATSTPTPPDDAEREARRARLHEAAARVQARQPNEALALLDGLIAQYDTDPRDPETRYLCGSSESETLLYLLQAASLKQRLVVLDSTWSNSVYLRGYVLIDLRRDAEARAALQQAVDLSPRNPQYLSELAQLLARTGGAEQALALFRTAQESTEFLGPATRLPPSHGPCAARAMP